MRKPVKSRLDRLVLATDYLRRNIDEADEVQLSVCPAVVYPCTVNSYILVTTMEMIYLNE